MVLVVVVTLWVTCCFWVLVTRVDSPPRPWNNERPSYITINQSQVTWSLS